jgi:transposase
MPRPPTTSPPNVNVVAHWLQDAEWVHAKSNVAKHLGEAEDQVRRPENEALLAEDDDHPKGTRQLWLFNTWNLSPQGRRRTDEIRQGGLMTARAWAIKEEVRWFWKYVYSTSAEQFFDRCHAWG